MLWEAWGKRDIGYLSWVTAEIKVVVFLNPVSRAGTSEVVEGHHRGVEVG